ncbi:MAG: hypothetical protein V7L01_00265 [Nostoc sp.]|uniref:hypothetical protein n=1 Tax=Nostoc sp. TaxID=1180 RepID=UPI002FF4CA26
MIYARSLLQEARHSPSQQQSIVPKLPKALLMLVIEVMSAVLVENLDPRFDLANFVL